MNIYFKKNFLILLAIYQNGEIIKDKKIILKQYFFGGSFLFDLLTIGPYSYNILMNVNYFPYL